MSGIFKAYDIRGVYGKDLTDSLAFKIGRAFATFTECRKVVIGRDMRPHSEPLFRELVRGLTVSGADVIDIGLSSTPACYFANSALGADAGIMITASHNPGEWNGFKLALADAVPISGDTGIKDIEALVRSERFAPPAAKPGTVTAQSMLDRYAAHIKTHARLKRPIRIAIDFANSVGILEARALEGVVEFVPLFDTLDGTFPNHEANPLKADTLRDLQALVRQGGFDFGAAFDGDADRVGFVDERGDIIPMDIVTALIARDLLSSLEARANRPKATCLYDLRSTKAVREVIEEAGGAAIMSRVGHAFIKRQMREHDAIFAGELSGHYYFKDNSFAESSSLAAICMANIVSATNEPLSAIVRPIRRYAVSGELNWRVPDSAPVLAAIRERFTDGALLELDGTSIDFADWRFNVRASQTEPLLRLNVEANTPALLESKIESLLELIRRHGGTREH